MAPGSPGVQLIPNTTGAFACSGKFAPGDVDPGITLQAGWFVLFQAAWWFTGTPPEPSTPGAPWQQLTAQTQGAVWYLQVPEGSEDLPFSFGTGKSGDNEFSMACWWAAFESVDAADPISDWAWELSGGEIQLPGIGSDDFLVCSWSLVAKGGFSQSPATNWEFIGAAGAGIGPGYLNYNNVHFPFWADSRIAAVCRNSWIDGVYVGDTSLDEPATGHILAASAGSSPWNEGTGFVKMSAGFAVALRAARYTVVIEQVACSGDATSYTLEDFIETTRAGTLIDPTGPEVVTATTKTLGVIRNEVISFDPDFDSAGRVAVDVLINGVSNDGVTAITRNIQQNYLYTIVWDCSGPPPPPPPPPPPLPAYTRKPPWMWIVD